MEKKEKITSHLKHLVAKIYFPYFGEVAMQDCLKKNIFISNTAEA